MVGKVISKAFLMGHTIARRPWHYLCLTQCVQTTKVLTLKSTVVPMCTFNFTFTNSKLCPQRGLICSLWLLVEPTIISLYGTDTFFSVLDNGNDNVFCEARVSFNYLFD